jgi:hypothetical protein
MGSSCFVFMSVSTSIVFLPGKSFLPLRQEAGLIITVLAPQYLVVAPRGPQDSVAYPLYFHF